MHLTLRTLTLSFCGLFFAAHLVFGVAGAKAQNASAMSVRTSGGVPPKGIISLDPPPTEELEVGSLVEVAKTSQTPKNFRQFEAVSKGQIGDAQTLRLRFAAGAKLLTIKSTPEFKVEQGGSCVEGFSYTVNSTCTLLVRSTPRGPGRRLGKLEITNSIDAEPMSLGLGGYGYAPTISFTPSIISTVPGTLVSNSGLMSGAINLAVDGGDTLYIADTGNNLIRYIDSSGIISTTSGGGSISAPTGIAVDTFGDIYFSETAAGKLLAIYNYGTVIGLNGSGTDACTYATPCSLSSEALYSPGQMAMGNNNQLFFTNMNGGAALSDVQSSPTVANLYDPFTYQLSGSDAFTVDANNNLYSYWGIDSPCEVVMQSLYDSANSYSIFTSVVGGRTCGFSGDGGQARGAELGTHIGQMTFDIAGNLYLSDTTNQRVRRIDGSTGIITTIAGNGSTGYGGDGGAATNASLNAPAGVAVDSQGQVYILSSATTSGQVVRKVGVVGALNLGGLAVGTASAAQTVQVANTGNSDLDFTHVGFSSGNISDFVIDPNTTSCNFTVALAAGRSCKIGFIFTPGATGARSAVLSITDDTIAGVNTIQLSGTGYTTATLTPASFSYASTTVGSATAAQTATLTNTGKAIMTISSIVISGAGATSYSDTTTCGTTLAVGASCTISIVFKPTTTGTLAATLTVNDNALGGHQAVALTGVGVAAAAKPALAPTSLTFTSQAVGSTSAAQTIKLSNTGTAALGVTSIKMAGTNPGDYVLSNNCGTSVAAGGSCTITVSFKPTATGTRTASVSAATSTGTLTAGVSGTAKAAAVKTKVTLTSTANPMALFHTLLLTAEVKGNSTASPTGTVRLMEGRRMWGEGTLGGGRVEMRVARLTPGVHMLTAVYMGDAKNGHAVSVALRQVVVSMFSGGPVISQLGDPN